MPPKAITFFNLSKPKDPFPGNREKIGVIHTADRSIEIYMPSMSDLRGLTGMDDQEFSYKLAAAACGMEIEEFNNLPLVDGQEIINLLSEAMQKLKPVKGS